MPATTPISASETELATVKYNEDGLVAAIVQDAATRDVLMMAWMSAETGVGPAIASGSQTYSGICADLPVAPTKRRRQMAVKIPVPTSCGMVHERRVQPFRMAWRAVVG